MPQAVDIIISFRDKFSAGIRKVKSEMKGLGQEAKGLGARLKTVQGALGAFGLAAGGAAVVAAFSKAVGTFKEFDDTMRAVGAVSGATTEELQMLRDTAEKMGAETRFSASEAADGLRLLSMAGLSAADSIEVLPSVLQLASAGMVDLGTAADIATNVMSAFGLTVEELPRVNDVLVKTFTSTNTTLGELGEAFKLVGPIAKGLGADFEDLNAALGQLGNAGLKGSLAGTSLRGALNALFNPTKEEAKLMEEIRKTWAPEDIEKALKSKDAKFYRDLFSRMKTLGTYKNKRAITDEGARRVQHYKIEEKINEKFIQKWKDAQSKQLYGLTSEQMQKAKKILDNEAIRLEKELKSQYKITVNPSDFDTFRELKIRERRDYNKYLADQLRKKIKGVIKEKTVVYPEIEEKRFVVGEVKITYLDGRTKIYRATSEAKLKELRKLRDYVDKLRQQKLAKEREIYSGLTYEQEMQRRNLINEMLRKEIKVKQKVESIVREGRPKTKIATRYEYLGGKVPVKTTWSPTKKIWTVKDLYKAGILRVEPDVKTVSSGLKQQYQQILKEPVVKKKISKITKAIEEAKQKSIEIKKQLKGTELTPTDRRFRTAIAVDKELEYYTKRLENAKSFYEKLGEKIGKVKPREVQRMKPYWETYEPLVKPKVKTEEVIGVVAKSKQAEVSKTVQGQIKVQKPLIITKPKVATVTASALGTRTIQRVYPLRAVKPVQATVQERALLKQTIQRQIPVMIQPRATIQKQALITMPLYKEEFLPFILPSSRPQKPLGKKREEEFYPERYKWRHFWLPTLQGIATGKYTLRKGFKPPKIIRM